MRPPPGIVVNTRFGLVALTSAEVLGIGRIGRIFKGANLERVGCGHCANLYRAHREARQALMAPTG